MLYTYHILSIRVMDIFCKRIILIRTSLIIDKLNERNRCIQFCVSCEERNKHRPEPVRSFCSEEINEWIWRIFLFLFQLKAHTSDCDKVAPSSSENCRLLIKWATKLDYSVANLPLPTTFRYHSGRWFIVGIASFSSFTCSSVLEPNFHTHTRQIQTYSQFVCLIETQIVWLLIHRF